MPPALKRFLSRALLVMWGLVAFVLFLLMGGGRAFMPNPVTRSRVSRTKSDMRSLATAIESYYVDNDVYFAEHPLTDFIGDPTLLSAAGGEHLSTMEPGRGESLHGLTTPIAYMSGFYIDPFTGRPRHGWFAGYSDTSDNPPGSWPFAYHASADGKGWILWSPGPDEVYDIRDPATLYVPGEGHSPALIELTYDPTNGRTSRGDVFRVKQ